MAAMGPRLPSVEAVETNVIRRRYDFILLADRTIGPLSAKRRGDSWRSNPHPSKAAHTSRQSFLRGRPGRALSQDHLRGRFPDFSLVGPRFPTRRDVCAALLGCGLDRQESPR